MELKEAFAVLEIEDGSSLEESRTAYRRLCIVWHPDRFKNPELKAHAEEKLKRINQAFATIKSSIGAGESAVDTDPGIVYQDLHCRYRGGDKRLWDVSIREFKGRHSAVQIAPDGLLLVTFRDGQMDQFATYSPDTFVRLSSLQQEWIRPTDKSRFFSRWRYDSDRDSPDGYGIPANVIEIVVMNPEGIVSRDMTVKLTFRSDYYNQLFVIRMREAWGLVKPAPTPKPLDPDSGKWVDLATGCIIFVFVAYFILVGVTGNLVSLFTR